MDEPWVSIIGLNEDSLDGLSAASRRALEEAQVVIGGARHLELVQAGARGVPWPVPFSTAPVLAERGKRVAVLASGDPFWFGAGGSLMAALAPGEWRSFPAASSFQLAANALGWKMEDLTCHGLHAAPYARLRGALRPQGRMICTLRDGAAPAELAEWLVAQGGGDAVLHVMECLGGPRARLRKARAAGFDLGDIAAPVMVAVELPGDIGLPRSAGLPDDLFASDGQITKAPMRALSLSALAPRPGARLWDIGAGSGSISVEWCLAGGCSDAFELRGERAQNIRANAEGFGVEHRLQVHLGDAISLLDDRPLPDAVFIGGGGNMPLLETLFDRLPKGCRLVANGVTLETESLLAQAHSRWGGSLLRVELSQAAPLGRMRGWQAARPVVQWSVTL
ncbi:MAG: precorrin-6y C5,15-methyltransferase (decarboxylating) subunit CbiE [Sulfitobacter sp.]